MGGSDKASKGMNKGMGGKGGQEGKGMRDPSAGNKDGMSMGSKDGKGMSGKRGKEGKGMGGLSGGDKGGKDIGGGHDEGAKA